MCKMHLIKKTRILILFLLINYLSLSAAGNEINPFIKNYSPRHYKGHPQVWDFAQSKNGVMYFANSIMGVLEYNGTIWRRIILPGSGISRSMDTGKDGKVYIGATGELGYLETHQGITRYISLVHKLPEKERIFQEVWQTIATPEGIYFRTRRAIFLYRNGRMDIFKTRTAFYYSGYVHGYLYVTQAGAGLVRIKNGVMETVPAGDYFYKNRIVIYGILPYENNNILFLSRGNGSFLYDGVNVKPFSTEADFDINEKKIYNARQLKNGHYVICTKEDGIVIMDKQGKVIRRYNTSTGLIDETIYNVFEDKQGGLWIGTSNGISRIDFRSPIKIFDETTGFKGYIENINRFQGRLVIATALGVFIQNEGKRLSFSRIPEITTSARKIVVDGNMMVIASNGGYYTVFENRVNFYNIKADVFHLSASLKHPGHFYAGTNRGLYILKRMGNEIKLVHIHKQSRGKIKSLIETENGMVYFNGEPGTIYVKDFSRDIIRQNTIKKYNKKHGIPYTTGNLHYIDKRIYWCSSAGMYEFLPDKEMFLKSRVFGEHFMNHPVENLFIGHKGDIWIIVGIYESIWVARKKKTGKYAVKEIYVLNLSANGLDNVFAEPDGTVWFGGPRNLTSYRYRAVSAESVLYPVQVAAVQSGNVSLFGSAVKHKRREKAAYSDNGILKIPYQYNALQFTLAFSYYGFESAAAYSVKLEGQDANWSRWTNSPYVNYNSLSEGNYTLLVRARDVYGNISQTTSFRFAILTPWYRTGYAYILYALSLIGLVLGVSYLRSRKLRIRADEIEARRKILEIKVDERTKELQNTAEELSEAYKTIKEDLNLAKRIQTNLLPHEHHRYPDLDFAVHFQPMIEVGGDIYHIYRLKDNYYRIFIADATGHGIQAALTTTIVITEYDKIKNFPNTPDKVLNYLNSHFVKTYYNLMVFFTCAIVDIDLSKNKIYVSSAGHPDLLWISGNDVTPIRVKGKMIGITENTEYSLYSQDILPQDKILLFTDGLFEEFDQDGNELGEQGILEKTNEYKSFHIKELCSQLSVFLNDWLGEMPVNDDITLIGIEIK